MAQYLYCLGQLVTSARTDGKDDWLASHDKSGRWVSTVSWSAGEGRKTLHASALWNLVM